MVAKFINPREILFDFKMLKNFKSLFKKRSKYSKGFDQYDHGFEDIKAFCEIK